MTRGRSPRAFVWLLLAAALFVRAVLPQGLMAEPREDTLVLKLCSGGMMMMPVGEELPAQDDPRAAAPCAFAGVGSPAIPPPGMAELPLADPAPLTFGHLELTASARAAFEALPPARGPPLPA